MPDLVIQPATNSERDLIAAWMVGSEPWTTLGTTLETATTTINDSLYNVFVARKNGTPCGAVVLQEKGVAGSPYLKSLVVAPEARDQGIGASLLRYTEDHFRTHARHLFLCVSSFNERARKFYEQYGYKKVGEFPDYISAGKSEILLHKILS